jgi:hypothetical protein
MDKAKKAHPRLLFHRLFLHYESNFFQLKTGCTMSSVDPLQLAKRIDTVLDILVGGDHASAINNLEILKAELLSLAAGDENKNGDLKKSPWEI